MPNPYLFGKNADLNDMLGDIFDTDSGHRHDGSDSRKTPYSTVIAGKQAATVASCNVTLASIAASDIVVANVVAWATACYVSKITISSGSGFLVTLNVAPGNGSVSYVVFKNS